ncbi:hypothetical protein ACMAY7_07180 [Rhodobacteraceae bacterium nBUS_24]
MKSFPLLSKANIKRQLMALSKEQSDQVTEDVLSEGRIFFLGKFEVDLKLFELSNSVMSNLKDNVRQPFGIHSWYFSMDVKWPDHAEYTSVMVRVDPDERHSTNAAVLFFQTKADLSMESTEGWDVMHSEKGFTCRRLTETGFTFTGEFAPTCYMIAIACLNTKGCNVSQAKKNNLMKSSLSQRIPHYDVDASEYITAIRSKSNTSENIKSRKSLRRSPIPHLRRGHERISGGKRIWVRDALINVKKEGDVAFVEKRLAYVVK